MAYQEYPIYDLKSGLRLEKEPWITPADGFRTIKNAFVRRGVMEKRRGLGTFGRVLRNEEAVITGASGTIAGITTATPIVQGTVSIKNASETIEDVLKYQVAFTNGGTDEPHVGDLITGATSGSTAYIYSITVTTGTWAGGNAAGTIYLVRPSAAFTAAGEAVAVGAETPFTIAAGGLVSTGLYVLAGTLGTVGTLNILTGAWALTYKTGPFYRLAFYAADVSADSEVIIGETSAATTTVELCEITRGTLLGGDAQGILWVGEVTGTFTVLGELANFNAGVDHISVCGTQTEASSILTYSWYPGEEILGIYRHRSSTGETLIVGDAKRFNTYNTIDAVFEDPSTQQMHFTLGASVIAVGDVILDATTKSFAIVLQVDLRGGTWAGGDAHGILHVHRCEGAFAATHVVTIADPTPPGRTNAAAVSSDATRLEMTSDDSNFIWFDTWNGITYTTNNKDPIIRFDGTYYRQLPIDLGAKGGPDNNVTICLMVIIFKSRIVLLSTEERGIKYNQRARYGDVNSDTIFPDDSYVDCPTSDWITGARFVGDQLIVTFTKSVWRLVYTGDSTLPFRWERISDEFGGLTPFSMISFDRRIEILGETEISACFDGLEVKKIDQQIPDFVLDSTLAQIEYCYAVKVDELQQVWMTYVSGDSSDDLPDKILVRNFDENHWATLDFSGLGIHCLGFFRWETSPTWDGLPAALGLPLTVTSDDIDVPFSFRQAQAGFPVLLLGTRTGYVYQYSVVYSDFSVNMPVQMISGKWNPFIQQGKKARLGYIDFYVDNVADATLTIYVYLDDETSPSFTLTFNCYSSRTSDLMKLGRIFVGAVANFFTIDIRSEHSHSQRIHAIVPAFQPAGRVDLDG